MCLRRKGTLSSLSFVAAHQVEPHAHKDDAAKYHEQHFPVALKIAERAADQPEQAEGKDDPSPYLTGNSHLSSPFSIDRPPTDDPNRVVGCAGRVLR